MARMQASRIRWRWSSTNMAAPTVSSRSKTFVEMVVGDIEDEHDDDEVNDPQDLPTMSSSPMRAPNWKRSPNWSGRIRHSRATRGRRYHRRPDLLLAWPHSSVAAKWCRPAGFEFRHVLEADPRRIKKVRITRKRVAPRRRVQSTGRAGTGAHGIQSAGPGQASRPRLSAISWRFRPFRWGRNASALH